MPEVGSTVKVKASPAECARLTQMVEGWNWASDEDAYCGQRGVVLRHEDEVGATIQMEIDGSEQEFVFAVLEPVVRPSGVAG